MTGFARVHGPSEAGELTVTIKSVNHRGLDLHFHVPGGLEAFESAIRGTIKRYMVRGHVQVTVSLARTGAAGDAFLDHQMLAAYLRAFDEGKKKYDLGGGPDLNAALRVPGMFRTEPDAAELPAGFEQTVLDAIAEACAVLNGFREREGEAIAAEMRARSAAIAVRGEGMERLRSTATAAFSKRLNQRLEDLLKGAPVDPQRLVQEAAMLADRSDISEELIRLRTHAAELDALLDSSGEVGKKLDFLLQEMNRETNTILSKTGGVGEIGLTLTGMALEVKAEIDKIREQSLNLE